MNLKNRGLEMGSSKNIYFTDQNVERLEKVENQSELINNLLDDYFNQDIVYLEDQKRNLNEQITVLEFKIKQKRDLLKVRSEAEQVKKQQYELGELKRDNEILKRAASLVFNHDLNAIFTKVVYTFLKSGSWKYENKYYSYEGDFLLMIKEKFGTIDEPTEKFRQLDEKAKEGLKRGWLP